MFEEIQRLHPVHHAAVLGGWMVTGYEEVCAALKHPGLSSDRIRPFIDALEAPERTQFQNLGDGLRAWAVFQDPPRHTRIRALFNKAFTLTAAKRMRASIEAIATELLERILGRGSCELISEFAYPLPAFVICEMLGIPREDIQQIRAWSDEVATFIGLPKKPFESYLAADRSNEAMSDYFRKLIRDQRERPRPNLLSELITLRDGGDALTEAELVATCNLLLFAAHTTTTHLIGNGLLALLRNPTQLALLQARPELLEAAVEELLRYDGPIQAVRRVAQEPLELGGEKILPGELVFLMLNAANRDERVFTNPAALNIERAPNRHVAFGLGIHFCVGAALARLEGQIALRALLSRNPELGAEPARLRWTSSFGFRGLESLPIRFRGGAGHAPC